MRRIKKNKQNFSDFSPINSTLFGIGLKQKLSKSHKNICFYAIQNGGKSDD